MPRPSKEDRDFRELLILEFTRGLKPSEITKTDLINSEYLKGYSEDIKKRERKIWNIYTQWQQGNYKTNTEVVIQTSSIEEVKSVVQRLEDKNENYNIKFTGNFTFSLEHMKEDEAVLRKNLEISKLWQSKVESDLMPAACNMLELINALSVKVKKQITEGTENKQTFSDIRTINNTIKEVINVLNSLPNLKDNVTSLTALLAAEVGIREKNLIDVKAREVKEVSSVNLIELEGIF